MRFGDRPRRRRMIRGTIARTGDLTMRYGHPSQLATLDCTSSRRSTVMCALPRATAVTTEYQRDSSSKRPRSSVAFAARVPSGVWNTTWQTRHPGLRALRAAPPAGTTQCTWGWRHPRPQYPERRHHARPRLLRVPSASWREPSRCPSTSTGRRRGLCHRPHREATEDSGVDGVAGCRRDEDRGARASGSGRAAASHVTPRHTTPR
jgi:hypothetical protein